MNGYMSYMGAANFQGHITHSEQAVTQLFYKTLLYTQINHFVERVLRRDRRPLNLEWLRRTRGVSSSHYVGVMTVPVEQIRGSEGRVDDFDASFRPLKAHLRYRWVSVARAYMANKSLPPVELFRIGDDYFIRDGHHRVSVARVIGQQSVDAVVTEMTLRE
jgi:hypothetical protein